MINRYAQIPVITSTEDPRPRYSMVKYPSIPLDSQDIYVYVNQGDRYDTLAQSFYNDSTLWWIINKANPSQDSNSLFPTAGAQIRVPSKSRVASIISQYENLNR
jgi:hypothetical protein